MNTATLNVLKAIVAVTLERFEVDLVAAYVEKINNAVDDDFSDIFDDFVGEVFEAIFSTHPDLDVAKYRFPLGVIAENILRDAI